jgi:hypothetical protein
MRASVSLPWPGSAKPDMVNRPVTSPLLARDACGALIGCQCAICTHGLSSWAKGSIGPLSYLPKSTRYDNLTTRA